MKIDDFYNKLIIVGNGFDLAHSLKTSYRDFIEDFWEKEKQKVTNGLEKEWTNGYFYYSYEDEFISVISPSVVSEIHHSINTSKKGYQWFIDLISSNYSIMLNGKNITFNFEYKNIFLKLITEKSFNLNWSDIEAEYYFSLKQCLNDKWPDGVEKLNDDFFAIKKILEEYLTIQTVNIHPSSPKMIGNLMSIINSTEIENKQSNSELGKILFLIFNYTNTVNTCLNVYFDKYSPNIMLNHIHGELNSKDNRIIFGYGDDIDDNYKLIENLNNNNYLENVKSMKYQEAENYKKMLAFIDSRKYQIFIMGHSCGISDRTLLNTLFEHENCISIKVFYHKFDDGTDNYNDLVMNISRNFKDKALMRRKLVAKTSSETF